MQWILRLAAIVCNFILVANGLYWSGFLVSCTISNQKRPVQPTSAPLLVTQTPFSQMHCQAFVMPIPAYLQNHSFMLTRFLKPCALQTGGHGFQEKSSFVGMGFPCAGSDAKMEVNGYFFAPKLVRFSLDTACPMLKTSQAQIQQDVVQTWRLNPSSALLAINPFAVQYWEIPDFGEADVGDTLELRSVEVQFKKWNLVTKGKSIEVRLYGRENAWTQDNIVYEVQGELLVVSQHHFQLRVKVAKAMTKGEEKQVLVRCKALQPARECDQVFTDGA